MFKIVVFTYDRYDTISTALALEETGAEFQVVCHSVDAAAKFIEAGRVKSHRLWISNAPKGLANNRNAWMGEFLKEGEWSLQLVDDWMYATSLAKYELQPDPLPIDTTNTTAWNRKLRHKITMTDFLNRAGELVADAEAYGARLAGFAGYTNPLFRRNRLKRNVLADGRALLVKKTHLRFDDQAQMVDDVAFSALNIECFGKVLVNQWVLPLCRRYTRGGYGSIDSRMEQRLRECKYLVERFPGLVTYADKTGWPAGSHVRLRSLRGDALRNWRMSVGAFRRQVAV